jgi:hypothetical protein
MFFEVKWLLVIPTFLLTRHELPVSKMLVFTAATLLVSIHYVAATTKEQRDALTKTLFRAGLGGGSNM